MKVCRIDAITALMQCTDCGGRGMDHIAYVDGISTKNLGVVKAVTGSGGYVAFGEQRFRFGTVTVVREDLEP